MGINVGLSTASVWPQPAEAAFAMAGRLGFDGVEVMVWTDPVSQSTSALRELSTRYGMPVLSVHAPCLLITQRVWSSIPGVRLTRAVEMAVRLSARTVVVHPPFRWQLRYAWGFAALIRRLEEISGVAVAVENMFGLRPLGHGPAISGFTPSADPTDVGHRHYTLDLSHTAAAGMDAMALADRMGAGLVHVHLADGDGAPSDEHLVPGTGTQPCGLLCQRLAREARDVTVVVEVSTKQARCPADRERALGTSLAFARHHLG